MITAAVVGAGNWGKNHIRTFSNLENVCLKYIYDANEQRLISQGKLYPRVRKARNYKEILEDTEVQGIVIASSAASHYPLAREALLAGKDVLVEKPFTLSSADGDNLVELASKRKRIIMVGHLLIYHTAVRKLKEIIDSGELGTLYYIYTQRLNLGVIRQDENVLWSLSPHDISVINYLLDAVPTEVHVHKGAFIQERVEDAAFLHMVFDGNKFANVHVSWLDPHKVRKITVVGSKKMVVFNDMEVNEKIRIYDKGVKNLDYRNYGESIGLRFGNIVIPRLNGGEPLRLEAEHFIDCIRTRKSPLTDGVSGVNVVRILEASERSVTESNPNVKIRNPDLEPGEVMLKH